MVTTRGVVRRGKGGELANKMHNNAVFAHVVGQPWVYQILTNTK